MLSRSELGRQIRALRHDRGLSMFEFAKVVGMRRSTLNDTELGSRYPTLQEAVVIARYFGSRVDRFIAGDINVRTLRSPLEVMLNRQKEANQIGTE